MGSHQFDKIIKDKLQFHKSKVDPILWDKIEAQLPGKEESRRVPFWWTNTAIIAGLIFVGTLVWFMGNHATTNDRAPVTSSMKSVVSNASTSTAETQLSDNIASKKTTSSSFISSSRIVKENNVNSNSHTSSTSTNNSFENHSSNTFENEILYDDFNVLNQKDDQFIQQAGTFVKSQSTIDAASEIDIHRVYPYPSKSKKIVIKDNCLDDFNHGKKGAYLEVYYGNDFPIRTLAARDASYNQVVQSRKETETPLYSFSLGARLGFNLDKHLRLMTGVHYSQINEKFEFVDPESSQTKIVKTILYIKDGEGMIKDSTFTYDTIYIPGTLIYKIKNQYSMVDLPLLLGWQAYTSDKMCIYVNAGVFANLAFKKEGMALVDDRYVVRTFKDMSSNTFNHSLGISTYLGAQFCYRLQSGFEVFLEPNVRIQHRGLTTKDYPVKQNYTTPSVLIGTKYNF